MLRLVLDPENRTEPPIELDTRDVSLQISFASSDLSKSGSAKAAHSLAFKLPFSDINDEALGYMNLLDVSSETRVERRCDVYDEDLLVLEGNLQVRSADLQSRSYDCVIYGLEAGVWQTLKRSRWVDVFTYDGNVTTLLDHNHDAEAVKKTQSSVDNDVTDGQVGQNIIHYPLQYPPASNSADASQQAYYLPTPVWFGQTSGGGGARVHARDYLPAIQMQYLLQQAFLHCGYTLDVTAGAFAAGGIDYDKLYQTFARENLQYRPYISPQVSGVIAEGGDNPDGNGFTGVNSPLNPNFEYIAFAAEEAGDADPDNFFGDIVNLGGFIPPGPGVYNMRITLDFEVTGSSSVETLQLGVLPFDLYNGTYGATIAQFIGVDETELVLDFQYVVGNTNTLHVPLLIYSIPNGRTLTFNLSDCKLTMQSYIGDSPKISIPNSFGRETVDKWLSAVMAQFNLLLTLDNEAKTATLHSKVDYYEDDVREAKDWSTRLDRGQSILVKNNLDRLYRQTIFTDKESDDYFGERYQTNQGKGFTDYTYNSGLALAQPSEEVGGYWSPLRYNHPPNFLPTGSVYTSLPRAIVAWNFNEANVTNAAQYALNKTVSLFFKRSFFETWDEDDPHVGDGYNLFNSANFGYNDTYETIRYWKAIRPYQANVTQLSWADKSNYDQMGTGSTDSLFQFAYGDEFRKKYSKEARSVECMLHLTPDDIRQFNYSDLIVIDGIYYNVEGIDNYAVGERRATKVKLNKLLDVNEVDTGNISCDLFVNQIAQNGIVSWQDRDGVAQTGTQECCEFYGGGEWTWNPYTNLCTTGATIWQEPAADWDADGPPPLPPPPLIDDGNGSVSVEVDTDGRSNVTRERYKLTAKTKGTVVKRASSAGNTDQFVVPYDCVVGLEIRYTAQVVSETGKGELQFGEVDATFRTDGATIEKIASDGEVYKNGDAGATSLVVSVTYADGRPRFSIDCTGVAARDFEWAINVEAYVQRTPPKTDNIPVGVTLQDGQNLVGEASDPIQYQ